MAIGLWKPLSGKAVRIRHLLPTPNSLLPITYSPFPNPYSLFPNPYFRPYPFALSPV